MIKEAVVRIIFVHMYDIQSEVYERFFDVILKFLALLKQEVICFDESLIILKMMKKLSFAKVFLTQQTQIACAACI